MLNGNRRQFLQTSLALGSAAALRPLSGWASLADKPGSKMQLGFCTYLWGQDWDLPTLISNCEKAGVLAVETRTEHKHGVEPSLNAQQRAEVRKRFADSQVKLLGPGTNEAYHYTDAAQLKKSIERTKEFVKLSRDCGGTGVKVKPNDLPKGVEVEKTVAQIGKSLNEVGKFAAELGQEIRLEVHGGCSRLPIMKQIMDHVDQPNVGLCWNSNGEDLQGEGLVYNFNLVKNRLGTTAHIRELNVGDYPYQDLIDLLVANNYAGWLLLECRTKPADLVAAMKEQRELFAQMVAKAQAKS
jgi:sugar phosphate isomerase/epimerase